MSFSIEVKITKPDGTFTWERLRPTGGEPYSWEDRRAAERMMWVCYPDLSGVRIVEETK